MSKLTSQQKAMIAAVSFQSFQKALFAKYPSYSSGTFHPGMIDSARKKNRRNKIIRRRRSLNIK